jgi:UDP-N-acetylmuramate dehydrogenase
MQIHKNVHLSEILFYKVGGKAAYLLEVQSIQDFQEALLYIKEHSIQQKMVVGLGSNLIMPDSPYVGAIIRFVKPEKPAILLNNDNTVSVFAGHTIDDVIQFSFSHQLIGLEALGGLPSTVGGAIRGNAGAFGTEMKDVIERVDVFDLSENCIKTLSNHDCSFSYRDSIFKHNRNLIVLQGYFHFQPAPQILLDEAKKTYLQNIQYRQTHHPVEYPSCGSVFKNIKDHEKVQKILSVWPDIREQVEMKWHGKVSMGYVNKRLGFSGVQIGGAKITEKHANYISNIDHASAADIMAIINQISSKFTETFGFHPELEAEIFPAS